MNHFIARYTLQNTTETIFLISSEYNWAKNKHQHNRRDTNDDFLIQINAFYSISQLENGEAKPAEPKIGISRSYSILRIVTSTGRHIITQERTTFAKNQTSNSKCIDRVTLTSRSPRLTSRHFLFFHKILAKKGISNNTNFKNIQRTQPKKLIYVYILIN